MSDALAVETIPDARLTGLELKNLGPLHATVTFYYRGMLVWNHSIAPGEVLRFDAGFFSEPFRKEDWSIAASLPTIIYRGIFIRPSAHHLPTLPDDGRYISD